MESVRMVLMLSRSMSCWETLFASSRSDVALMSGGTGEVGGTTVTLMQSFRAGFRRRSKLGRGCEWPALLRQPLLNTLSNYSDRCGHLHPVISGLSIPFLYA